jgi:PKD domain
MSICPFHRLFCGCILRSMNTPQLVQAVVVIFLVAVGGLGLSNIIDAQNETPSADFYYETPIEDGRVLAGYGVQFYGDVRDDDDDEMHWLWEFGNGMTSSDLNPRHVFPRPGDYPITLTVTDARGKVGRCARSIHVEPSLPVASFEFSPMSPRAGLAVQFTDTSSHPGGLEIVRKQWFFNLADESLSATAQGTDRLEEHVYDSAGTYRVKLVVVDELGQSSMAVKEVVVGDLATTISSLENSIRSLNSEVGELRLAVGELTNAVGGLDGKVDLLGDEVRISISGDRFNVGMLVQWLGIFIAVLISAYSLWQQRRSRK